MDQRLHICDFVNISERIPLLDNVTLNGNTESKLVERVSYELTHR